ncbi:MAG: alpha/beta hydrolase [Fretibacterium sp.]|nr:alpha/beta hydrolase [Fretibacterium sp.]
MLFSFLFRLLYKTALFLGFLLVLLLVGLRLFFPSMVFHPTATVRSTPQDLQLEYEDVTFQSDGLALHGWYIPAYRARATVLFLHGSGGNIGNRMGHIRILHDLGLSVFIFDYRGYGRSGGTASVKGVGKDARAAWDWLVKEKGTSPSDIVLLGRSFGGALALELTRSVQPGALILESTFASPFGFTRLDFLTPLMRFAVGDIWNPLEAAKRLTVPTLCIHSPDDGVVPFREGQKLYNAIRGEKTFVQIRGGHNEGFAQSRSTYTAALENFLADHFGRH